MHAKVQSQFSQEDREKWAAIEKEKRLLTKSMSVFPFRIESFKQKTSAYVDTIVQLKEELHRTTLQTKGVLEQLQVLEVIILKANAQDQIMRGIKKERKFGADYLATLARYQADVEAEKNRLLLRGDLLSKTITLRSEYVLLLHRESSVLHNYLHELGAEAQTIAQLEDIVNNLMNKTESFSRKLNSMVRKTLWQIKGLYESERIKIEHYQSESKQLMNNINDLARLALFSNINKVKQTFETIILQADVGVINVAWEGKDSVTEKLLRYRTEKARELQRLNLNLEGLE